MYFTNYFSDSRVNPLSASRVYISLQPFYLSFKQANLNEIAKLTHIFCSNCTNICRPIFYPLGVVGRGIGTQLQVGKNKIAQCSPSRDKDG